MLSELSGFASHSPINSHIHTPTAESTTRQGDNQPVRSSQEEEVERGGRRRKRKRKSGDEGLRRRRRGADKKGKSWREQRERESERGERDRIMI